MPLVAMPPGTAKSRLGAALSRWRFAAVVGPLLLAGCTSGGPSPLGSALQEGLIDGGPPAERAEAIPYASLQLDAGDRRGLVVMGAQAGDTTLWPTGNQGLVTLYREGLQATAGLERDLLDTRYRPAEGGEAQAGYVPWREAEPGTFYLSRSWQTPDGGVARQSAQGRLACGAPEPRELLLASLALQRCEQRLTWDDGRETTATLWRESDTRRLWAVAETPWPGGPLIEWEVVRPWW